jgi:hypothetical protein
MSPQRVPDQGGQEFPEGLTRDELFHVLRNQRRRFAIHYLKRESEAVTLGELATHVAAWENGESAVEVTSRERRRVYNALQQSHIPLLDRTGVVEVNRHEIELTDQAEELDVYLEVVPSGDISWNEYYLALGSVGLSVLVVAWLDVGPFGMLPDIAAGMFLGIALSVSAIANVYYQRGNFLGNTEEPPELRGER